MLLTRQLKKLFRPQAPPPPQPASGKHPSETAPPVRRALVLVSGDEADPFPMSYTGWVRWTLGIAGLRMADIAARVRQTADELRVSMDAVRSTVPLPIDGSDAAATTLRVFLDILSPNGFIDIRTTGQDGDSMAAVLAGAGFPFSHIEAAQGGEGSHVLAFRTQPTPDQRARYQLRPRSVWPSDCRV